MTSLVVSVVHPSGEVIIPGGVCLQPSDCICVLRQRVIVAFGDDITDFKLVSGVGELNDDSTVEECGVQNGDTVTAVKFGVIYPGGWRIDDDGFYTPSAMSSTAAPSEVGQASGTDGSEVECCICLESVGEERLTSAAPCPHRFCRECAQNFIRAASTSKRADLDCPLCRARLPVVWQREQFSLDLQEPPAEPTEAQYFAVAAARALDHEDFERTKSILRDATPGMDENFMNNYMVNYARRMRARMRAPRGPE